ncbi:MAG TPA: hypothetical protein VMT73_10920, partial [Anaerolineales bacterium]|nr:hypothetical protein [Anaerolineales bacterium]
MSNESQNLPPDSSNNEPTVLDVFKSATRNWRSFFSSLTSIFSAQEQVEPKSVTAEETPSAPPTTVQESKPAAAVVPSTPFPSRSVLAIMLAVFGQAALEPPNRHVAVALTFYAIAIAFGIWAFLRDEWQLASLRENLAGSDSMSVRLISLIISAIFAVISFFAFSGNLFTITNLTLWAISLFFFFRAFWEKPKSLSSIWKSTLAFVKRK